MEKTCACMHSHVVYTVCVVCCTLFDTCTCIYSVHLFIGLVALPCIPGFELSQLNCPGSSVGRALLNAECHGFKSHPGQFFLYHVHVYVYRCCVCLRISTKAASSALQWERITCYSLEETALYVTPHTVCTCAIITTCLV